MAYTISKTMAAHVADGASLFAVAARDARQKKNAQEYTAANARASRVTTNLGWNHQPAIGIRAHGYTSRLRHINNKNSRNEIGRKRRNCSAMIRIGPIH